MTNMMNTMDKRISYLESDFLKEFLFTLSRELKSERTAQNLRQAEVARRFDRKKQSFSRWESGNLTTLITLEQICEVYDVSPLEMMGRAMRRMANNSNSY